MTPSRTLWIDWLRGLAVVFMVEIHTYDAWLADAARAPVRPAWWWAMHLGGFAAPLFLFLAGLMVGFRPSAPRAVALRGLQVIGYGYLFRLVLIACEGFKPWSLPTLYKVDILQQIGFSMILAAPLLGAPRRVFSGGLVALALLCALMPPLTALPPAPAWIRPLSDFVTGQRPFAFFPALPWAAYTIGGIAVGGLLRGAEGRRLHARMIALAVVGIALGWAAREVVFDWALRTFGDRGPNHGVDGVVRMLYRLGVCVALVPAAFAIAKLLPRLWAPLEQLGKTSLTIYVVHVPIVYGPFFRPWFKRKLDFAQASLAVAAVLALMLAVSVAWTRFKRWRRGRPTSALATPT
ncbi:MAG: heparan-alpha-glucosaminide N-acetyltransferase domain-containing protein [Myxococcota bacterium]